MSISIEITWNSHLLCNFSEPILNSTNFPIEIIISLNEFNISCVFRYSFIWFDQFNLVVALVIYGFRIIFAEGPFSVEAKYCYGPKRFAAFELLLVFILSKTKKKMIDYFVEKQLLIHIGYLEFKFAGYIWTVVYFDVIWSANFERNRGENIKITTAKKLLSNFIILFS